MNKNTDKKNIFRRDPRLRFVAIGLALALAAGATVFSCNPQLREGLSRSISCFCPTQKTSFCSAVTTDSLNLREGKGTEFRVIATLPMGAPLELLEKPTADAQWVKVRTKDGKTGWCSTLYLDMQNGSDVPSIPSLASGSSSSNSSTASVASASSAPAKPVMTVVPAQVTLEEASAPLTISVSIANQRVTVLDKNERVVKQFVCSTGLKGSETPTGTFRVEDRGESFYSKSLKEGGYYWTQFKGNYLFHSVPFGENRELEPEEAAKLGTPASHGCVRLAVEDAKWIYDHIPRETVVTIR